MIKQPKINKVDRISFPSYEKQILRNGIPVYILEGGSQPILKLDVIIHGGRYTEAAPLVSRTVSSLLKEGSKHHTSKEMAETLDYYGVGLRTPLNMDGMEYSFFMLEKHLSTIAPTLKSLLTEAIFPEEELTLFKNRCIEQINVDLLKNEIVAFREFTGKLFGDKHAYGYNSTVDMYKQLDRSQLLEYYNQHLTTNNISIILSGHVNQDTIEQLEFIFGDLPTQNNINIPKQSVHTVAGSFDFKIPDSQQSAIRMGHLSIGKKDLDFGKLYFTDTLFGGYFGSRLMGNIREEKGLTYGIYSSIENMVHESYWSISCEVEQSKEQLCIDEVKKEINTLQNDKVGNDELEMTRQYILGNLLQSLDGPIKSSELLKECLLEQIPFETFTTHINDVINIDSDTVLKMAQQYFNNQNLTIVTVK